MAGGFVTLGIGASPGSLTPFLLTGLYPGEASAEPEVIIVAILAARSTATAALHGRSTATATIVARQTATADLEA